MGETKMVIGFSVTALVFAVISLTLACAAGVATDAAWRCAMMALLSLSAGGLYWWLGRQPPTPQ